VQMNFKTGFIKGLVPVIVLLSSFLFICISNSHAAKLPGGESVKFDSQDKNFAYISNQVIIKFKHGYGLEDLNPLRTASVRNSSILPFSYDLLHIDGDVLDACSELMQSEFVQIAEPNFVRYSQVDPNDPKWPQQFNLILSNAPFGWNINTGSYDVTVAVIDTGVDYNHPDILPNLLEGMNFRGDGDSYLDDSGHGTAVCGVIGAVGNNGEGVAGSSWKVKLLPLRSCGGIELHCTVADEVEAIHEAINRGVDIINLSLGGFQESSLERDAVNAAWDAGIVMFAAVGNEKLLGKFDNPDLEQFIAYPAGYENVCGVSSIKYPAKGNLENVELSDFSNYGDAVSVTAMGNNIWTTAPTYTADYSIFQPNVYDYGKISGTSFSTPIVSGIAALIKSQFPEMTNEEIRIRIETSVWDIGDPGWDDKFGWGLVDFHKALIGGTHIENDAFILAVTASPIVTDEIIVIVKQKLPMVERPTLQYVLVTTGFMDIKEIGLHHLPNHDSIWSGRFNTKHQGAIRIRVSGEGTSGQLPYLEMEYFKPE